MIKHHNYYKVHLPKKDYKGESDEFAEVIMEEFYLVSNGEWTKNYIPTNPKTDQFEISLYHSIFYAANKLNYSEYEKFKIINDFFRCSVQLYTIVFDHIFSIQENRIQNK